MTLHVHLRLAEVSDVERLCKIINCAYRSQQSWTSTQGLVEGERITQKQLIQIISEKKDPLIVAEVKVTECESILAGCISAEYCVDHPELGLPKNSALIGLLSVDPQFQSHGIGKKLFQYQLEYVQKKWKCDKAYVWVIAQREDIIRWYERMGFEDTGEIRDFDVSDIEKPLRSDLSFKVYSMSFLYFLLVSSSSLIPI